MRNSMQPSLFCLPPEIRKQIWEEVLGREYIHISHQTPIAWKHCVFGEPVAQLCFSPIRPGLFHDLCVADISTEDYYELSKTYDYEAENTEAPRYQMPCLGEPTMTWNSSNHNSCIAGETNFRTPRLDLSLLRVCRQSYTEAAETLYTSNTFSFYQKVAFDAFMGGLNKTQIPLVRNLHILSTTEETWVQYGWADLTWDHILKPRIIERLQGLRTLHLYVDLFAPDLGCYKGGSNPKSLNLDKDTWFDAFLRFQVLPIITATVVLNDNQWPVYLNCGSPEVSMALEKRRRWTVKDKRAFAEHIRAKLLAST